MRRANLLPRFALLAGVAAGLPALFGCLKHPLKPVTYQAEIEKERLIDLVINRDVDVLFVIDNSGSMGEEQGKLAENFQNFIEVLEDPDVKANYRIGVTTTDVFNPQCGTSTSPENGKLQFSSCRARENDFIFDPGGQNVDKFEEACTNTCEHDVIDVIPTATEVDNDKDERRWLENQEGTLNVEDITATEAFQCIGPQGINGCGFESQLEAMYMALRLSDDAQSQQYGFIRQDAILAVVHVTDEGDCSFNKDYQEIFTDQESPFWHEDAGTRAYSSICFNAGVKCTGDGAPYSDCVSQNYDVDGDETNDEDEAVLHPISRYIDQLNGLEAEKKKNNQNQEVIVSVLGGVPEGYEDGQDLYYEAGSNEDQLQFGIGPGCTSGVGGELQKATPPVRMRQWAEVFSPDERNLFSICASNYGPALDAIANKIKEQIRPACYEQCARDLDQQAPGLQIQCNIIESPSDGEDRAIEECVRDGENGPYEWEDEDYVVPDGEDVCYAVLSDKEGQTEDEHDDMSDECKEKSWNLEFKLRRRPGAPAKPGTAVRATCSLSEVPEIDCKKGDDDDDED
ncbi:MAG: VWA domain-containing protein [Myxococcales bacterium FL481]|nr:MAG: VWA domain-containing protein [Myxococcales bacterium FL481]